MQAFISGVHPRLSLALISIWPKGQKETFFGSFPTIKFIFFLHCGQTITHQPFFKAFLRAGVVGNGLTSQLKYIFIVTIMAECGP